MSVERPVSSIRKRPENGLKWRFLNGSFWKVRAELWTLGDGAPSRMQVTYRATSNGPHALRFARNNREPRPLDAVVTAARCFVYGDIGPWGRPQQ